MKKTLIALAAVAVAGTASAQVVLGGKVGYGYNQFKGGATGTSRLLATDGGLSVAVKEDLGGGMKLSFSQAFQGAFGDTTTVQTDGGSVVLSGGFGSVTFAGIPADADNLGVGNTSYATNYHFAGGGSTKTLDNYTMFQYDLPAMGALTAGIRLAKGADTAFVGLSATTPQLRLGYAAGPLSLGFNAKSGASETLIKYDLGVAKVALFMDLQGAKDAKRMEYSVSVPLGAVTLAASYGKLGSTNGTELDLQYALTKRTMIRASSTSGKGGAITSANRIKLYHTF